ncbi:MAG: hypothetical protein L3J31_06935 [Bacteroidales bacterium]|nr:hypothetical protein [Bacteroidales bacterium]MCF6342522.1 hypothetical protein [Bacteroidales bacterium]
MRTKKGPRPGEQLTIPLSPTMKCGKVRSGLWVYIRESFTFVYKQSAN